ncbi:MAG: hypothetical protein A3G51_01515 [Candidatus Yanofskybacteria bacterium RIFCSPLOWO2_12_FULL_43_11b]|uniref:CN hydrolase domain-containing protein n=1 Tax=Candidatus Yanofskybacteria bacterium RIFCSPLOWO2_12_FULL_43_11b TaxID=1802710 RepID=A0A1F8HAS8_9BACT|nr:MAG: hypothetical protein A2742_03205 [Candidatus Yanofskybacteria bacterium RIFCSPHIGHO2_01_FULL_43_32]OGN10796.1 MAG: hypothetical protein A3C69_01375 [Candidatus Yanofskybacteria bacterium RIFCSPHIGHO2_02_FULL_43_12]OGN17995.1 MAG: hypothetical protein A3E34_01870 [Candidatus Yanofskybacteria bacterium RIFCSPHIGHO2_12_FULL_43_11]OGN25016.1 MAG: hypothetical protein A2923_03570 [Candidatus Yanofskybacteria bacterium RIFCSPLOWO2_01_FULL_43_46]OGN34029.1 MAG: hypothetical protein A3G51_01515
MDRVIKIYGKIARLRPSGFWPGFIVGLIYFSYIFRWYWPLYPLTNFGIESNVLSVVFILFMFSLSIAGTALFWGLFSFFILKATKKSSTFWIPLIAAGTFVFAEYAKAWGFGLLWLGNGSLLGPHWTLGNPAYLFVSWPFILRISSVWGIYGIDFLLIWTISIVYLLATGKYTASSRIFLLNLGLIIFIFFITIGLSTKSNEILTPNTIKISLIQTDDPAKFKFSADEVLDNYAKKIRMLKETAGAVDGGIVIFPESSNFSKTLLSFLDNNSAKNYFNRLSDKEFVIIDHNILQDQEGYKSKTLFINSKNGVSGFYDKQLLTPAGEYLPYILKLFFFALRKSVPIGENYELKAGTHSELLNYDNLPIKILVCSDVVSPGISSKNQYGLLVFLQNLSGFKGSKTIESQFLSMLRFRAAENGKYAVLASNFARSYVIDNSGNIVKSTDSSGYQILTADVVPNKERTWYNKLGDLPILLLSLAIFGLGLKNLRNAKQD